MKYLGIDYGKRKVGLAVSEGMMASPLRVLDSSSLLDALQKVLRVIEQEEIGVVVVGLAESGESRSMTEKFVQELKKKGLNVEIVEETLSSKRADELMLQNDVTRKKAAKNDSLAAVMILEDFLEKDA